MSTPLSCRHGLIVRLRFDQPFFWNKVSDVGAGTTVWSSIDADRVQIDMAELEKAFAVQTKAPQKARTASEINKITSLLSLARAQNIGMSFWSVKVKV